MMRTFSRLAAILAVGTFLTVPAVAGISFSADVLWRPNPDNDVQVFMHASNVVYPQPPESVIEVFTRVPDPYDYAVLAFIAHHARLDLGTVWVYRSAGHAWFDCMTHFGLQANTLFVDLPREPGPPYGKAYGHWRKHNERIDPRLVQDGDVRYWVQVQTIANYLHVPASRVYDQRSGGKRFEQMAGGHYRATHGKGNSGKAGNGRKVNNASLGGPSPNGNGKGKGKDKNKSHD